MYVPTLKVHDNGSFGQVEERGEGPYRVTRDLPPSRLGHSSRHIRRVPSSPESNKSMPSWWSSSWSLLSYVAGEFWQTRHDILFSFFVFSCMISKVGKYYLDEMNVKTITYLFRIVHFGMNLVRTLRQASRERGISWDLEDVVVAERGMLEIRRWAPE